MDMEPIEIDGILYHARDGELLREENGDPIPAHFCLCFALDKYECACGAWDMPIQKADRAEGEE